MKFLSASLLLVALSASAVSAETRASKPQPPPARLPPLKTTKISSSALPPASPQQYHVDTTMDQISASTVMPITKRRPMADAGLRYSSNDWFISFLTTPTSFTLRRVLNHLSFNVVIAALVAYFHDPTSRNLAIGMTGHGLLASSLGLLLSYRTNSAYGRFYEARGHWTKVKALCRNLAILCQTYIKPVAPNAAAELLELLTAFPSTLMHLCLGGAARLDEEAARLLPPPPEKDLYQLDYALPAMLMVKRMQEAVHHACEECPSSRTHLMISAHFCEAGHLINSLMDSSTSCEKILRTPVPWTYTRHTSRFLTIWMGTLPFALVGTVGKGLMIALVAVASYCMFGIEEISHLIEQPFLGDKLEGDNEVWGVIDENGEVAALIKRGRKTQPYDIGIPVCSLAQQIRDYVAFIGAQDDGHDNKASTFPSFLPKSSSGIAKSSQ